MTTVDQGGRGGRVPRDRRTVQAPAVLTADLPAAGEVPDDPGAAQVAAPRHSVNVTAANPYRYDPGGARYGRGVYEYRPTTAGGAERYWLLRAELPHVHARVVRRDGTGRRTGTEYVISATADGPRSIITADDITTGAWAERIGVDLSCDQTIIRAAGTALRHAAHRYAVEVEATPRPDAHTATGHLDLPLTECLPDGYLRTPPLSTEDSIRAAWGELVAILADRDDMALTLGAAVFGPYVGPLRRQSHWWDLHGEQRMGKSTALAVAAAVWGDPRLGVGIVGAWNATSIGSGRMLGQLGILPAFMDERGMSGMSPAEWGELIYTTCQGSSRLTAEVKGSGTRRSLPWFGVLFSTGNHRVTEGISAGRFAGVPARAVELAAPFTSSASESDAICKMTGDGRDGIVFRCYGWLGPQVLARYTVADARELVGRAGDLLDMPAGGQPRTIAEHLAGALAGAMMADAILGTRGTITAAARRAARAHLDAHSAAPDHDADRVLAAIAEAIDSTRPEWPTEAAYTEAAQERPDQYGGQRSHLPAHGVAAAVAGILSGDGAAVYVFPATWHRVCDGLGCDSSMALAELYRRGDLTVPDSERRAGKWTARPRMAGGVAPRVYRLRRGAVQPPEGASEPGPSTGPAGRETDGCDLCAAPGEVCGLAPHRWTVGLPCGLCGAHSDRTTDCGVVRCQACAGEPVDLAAPATVDEPATVAVADQPALPFGEPVDQGATAAPAAGTPSASSSSPGRPARRTSTWTTDRQRAQDDALAVARAAIDAGDPLRLLAALEGPYWPRRDKRAALWRPGDRLPGVAYNGTYVPAGYAWERPHDGPTVTLDRTGAWITAASSVDLAHAGLTHTGADHPGDRPGLYRVQVHPWHEGDRMPAPLGTPSVDTVVVPQPMLRLLQDLAGAGRWADADVLDSWTGDPCRISEWAHYVNDLRAYAINTYGRASDQYTAVKTAFSQATVMMAGHEKARTARPDWTRTIQAHSLAMMWRRADDARQLAPDLGPVALRNVDELVIPAAALPLITGPREPGRPRPIEIDPAGIRLGTFKAKTTTDPGSTTPTTSTEGESLDDR